MSEQKKSSEAKKPAQSNSSRSIAIGAVALLIVVAIAGIVLAGRHAPAPDTPGAAGGSVTTPQVVTAPTAANPNEVVFAAGSAKLPATAAESITKFAESARAGGNGVRMSARFLTGENKARDLELAKGRTTAVREKLQAAGVAPEKMQIELVEMPAGSLTEANSNRVDLTLR
jgi:outer membrane protein OmpA-like peptidoglycan-associated protein